jgi:hypothetical protein
MNVLCPHCLNNIENGLTVEPVYDLKTAAFCLAMSVGHLREWLSQHPEVPKLYTKASPHVPDECSRPCGCNTSKGSASTSDPRRGRGW